MKKIICVAVDDEPLALSVIETFCARLPRLELHCFNSPVLALEYILAHPVDILFLDINMPEMQGLEIASAIESLSYIIFTTAHAQYALESYEYNTVDYLLKPYNFARFEKAVQKALLLLETKQNEPTLSFKLDYRHILLPQSHILYLEAMGNYVKIHTRERSFLPQMTMKEAEALLDAEQFKRVHRSYIVNWEAVDSFSKRELQIGDTQIPVGKSYASVLNPCHDEA